MTTISWPNDTVDIIDAIRDAIGRTVYIYTTVSGIPCSGCSLDPMTGLSTDPFCGICDGEYWTRTASGVAITAHIRPGNVDTPIWSTGGFVVEGDVQIQIKHSVLNQHHVDNAQYYIVDDKQYLAKKISLRGVPDINRIVITLDEQVK